MSFGGIQDIVGISTPGATSSVLRARRPAGPGRGELCIYSRAKVYVAQSAGCRRRAEEPQDGQRHEQTKTRREEAQEGKAKGDRGCTKHQGYRSRPCREEKQMTAQNPQPRQRASAAHDRETQIMQAILYNCDALGVPREEAKRMATRSIVNLRRAKTAPETKPRRQWPARHDHPRCG